MNYADIIRLQRSLLEELFTVEWLSNTRPEHPARSRWSLCTTILMQGSTIRWPTQKDDLPELAVMLLDSATFVTISRGDLGRMRIGRLSGYGDDAVQRKISSRLRDPAQFNALMLELSTAAWHQSKGHHIKPLEDEGLPDLQVVIHGVTLPIYVECKRLTTSSEAGIQKRIRHANRQIKAVGEPCYGVVILDVSGAVGPIKSLSDKIPEAVRTILQYVERALTGPKNRSVGKVIVTWDDMGIMGQPPERTSVFFRRNMKHLNHDPVDGVLSLRDEIELFQGQTVFYALNWDDSVAGVKHLIFSDLMKECQQWFGFSQDELIDAFDRRDKLERVRIDENAHVLLFARRITWGGERAYILACAKRQDAALNLEFAFRLPPKMYSSVDLLTPLEMLAVFAERYGLPVAIGNNVARFIFRRRFLIPAESGGAPLVGVCNPQNHSFIQSMMLKVVRDDGQILVDCALVFAIDKTRLLADLGDAVEKNN